MRLLLCAVAMCAVGLASRAEAQEDSDTCSDLVEIRQVEGESVVSWAIGQIDRLFRAPHERVVWQATGIGDIPYWVTVRAGLFANVTCDGRQFEDQEMYLLGTVVKPVAVLDLPAFVHAGRGKPVLVLTEYGHRKIVSLDHIRPITPSAAYIFNPGRRLAQYCREAGTGPNGELLCPGNYAEPCDRSVHRCGYEIGGIHGFAMSAGLTDEVRETINAFRRLSGDRIGARKRLTSDDLEALTVDACRPFSVRAHMPGGERHDDGRYELSLCENVSGGRLSPLRVVDLERAADLFRHDLVGSFHRRLGTPESLFGNKVTEPPNLLFVKQCDSELVVRDQFTLGGSVGLNIAIPRVGALELGAERKATSTATHTVPRGQHVLYSTYFFRPIPVGGSTAQPNPWVFDVVFRSECEGGEPRQPSSIGITHSALMDGYMPLGTREDIFAEYQAETLDGAGYRPNRNPARLADGHFWHVLDHIGYVHWRDTLRTYIYEHTPIGREIIDRHPPEQRPLVRDFFVYLILSAAFSHNDPERQWGSS